jgi:uncharacterized membrane protein
MSASSLAAEVTVPFIAATMCLAPVITRPTVSFGVRVPPERTRATVIRQQRRAYFERTATIGICCIVAVILLRDYGSWWLSRIILLLLVAGNLGCYWIARKKITEVKHAENWYAGHRQVVATDTSWRADPPRFPVPWLIPALIVIAATVIVGVVRYPGLPARLPVALGHRDVSKSVVSMFAVVAAQLYVTALWTGLLLIVYRSRPDIEAADPAGSTRRYRRLLTTLTKAVLTLLALVDLSLLLAALRSWEVYRLSGPGTVLPVLPVAVGLPGATDRDDDRFWKAGLIYLNRDDPAIMVAARFGVGWTFNVANKMAWLIIAAIVAAPLGLIAIGLAAGM